MRTLFDIYKNIEKLSYSCDIIRQIGDKRNDRILNSNSYYKLLSGYSCFFSHKKILRIIRKSGQPIDEEVNNIINRSIPIFLLIAACHKDPDHKFSLFGASFIDVRESIIYTAKMYAWEFYHLCFETRIDLNSILAKHNIPIRFHFHRGIPYMTAIKPDCYSSVIKQLPNYIASTFESNANICPNIVKQSKNNLVYFIIKDHDHILAFLDNELSRYSKPQGKYIAILLIVLNKAGYMVDWNRKLSQILSAFRDRYGDKIGSQKNIEDYLRGCRNNIYSDKNITPLEIQEIENRLNQAI